MLFYVFFKILNLYLNHKPLKEVFFYKQPLKIS
jgi:hypothetical protein